MLISSEGYAEPTASMPTLASAQYGHRKMKSSLSIDGCHGTQPIVAFTSAEHAVTLHPAQRRTTVRKSLQNEHH